MKYIITSCITHSILLFLSFYAIGCCGFHILPVWGVAENYESINTTFLSIALSYVAGLVIYVLTSVLPRQQREKEVFGLWKPHLENLYNEMSERIEEVRAFACIDKIKMDSLTIMNCKPLERYTDLPSVIWLSKTIVLSGRDNPLKTTDEFNVKKVLNRHHDYVLNIIGRMLNNPMAVDAEKKILDILSQIKSSRFLSECDRVMDSSILTTPPISICNSELPKAFHEYVMLRDKLGTLPIAKSTYEMRVLTDEEVMENRKETLEWVKKQGYTIEQVMAFGQQINKASKREK